MKQEKYLRIKKLFIFGIIVSIVTIFGGEIPIGWVVNPEADNEILSMIMGYASLSIPQLACGVFFGGIGIPLQYYGYKAIAEIISKTDCKKCAKLTEIGAKAIAFGGATVHVICIALMYICKMECSTTFSAVFMTVYSILQYHFCEHDKALPIHLYWCFPVDNVEQFQTSIPCYISFFETYK